MSASNRAKRLHREMLEHIRLNEDPDATMEDARRRNRKRCGKLPGGHCARAGSEYCDFECPFR